jgi:hypothetical protein
MAASTLSSGTQDVNLELKRFQFVFSRLRKGTFHFHLAHIIPKINYRCYGQHTKAK